MSLQAPDIELLGDFSAIPNEILIEILKRLPMRTLVLFTQLNRKWLDLAVRVRWQQAELSALTRVPTRNGRRQMYANHIITLRVHQVSSENLSGTVVLEFPKLRSLKRVDVTRGDAAALGLVRHFAEFNRIIELEMLSSKRVLGPFIGAIYKFEHLKRLDIDFPFGSSPPILPLAAISWPDLERASMEFGFYGPPQSLVKGLRKCPSLVKLRLGTARLSELLRPSNATSGFQALRHLDIHIEDNTVIQGITPIITLTNLTIKLSRTAYLPPTSFSQLANLRDLQSLRLTIDRMPRLHPLFNPEVQQNDIVWLLSQLKHLEYFSWDFDCVLDTRGLIEKIASLQSHLQYINLGFAVHIPDLLARRDVEIKAQKSLRNLRIQSALFDAHLPYIEAMDVAATTVKAFFPSLKVFGVDAKGFLEFY